MTVKKVGKIEGLDDFAERRLVGIISVLINILASNVTGRVQGPNAKAFLKRVSAAFDEIYEKPSVKRNAWRKLTCFGFLVEAYESDNVDDRAFLLEKAIEMAESWRLTKNEGGRLTPRQIKNLSELAPIHKVGKDSARELALDRSGNLFGDDKSEKMNEYTSKYWRDVRKWKALARDFKSHYVVDLDAVDVAFVVLQKVMRIKKPVLMKIIRGLLINEYESEKLPLNNGEAAETFFCVKPQATGNFMRELSRLKADLDYRG